MTFSLQSLEAAFQKDEQWVVAEINKGWTLLQTVGHTIDVDIQNIFKWIQSHQSQIVNSLHMALTEAALVGSIVPGAGPIIASATAGVDAATVALDVLSKAIVAGDTPLHTIVNAYHAVKDAQTAVNGVLKQATSQPPAAHAA